MLTETERINKEEKAAIAKYKIERKKISDAFFTDMKKRTIHEGLISGTIGGALFAFILTTLVVSTTARRVSCDKDTHTTKSTLDKNALSKSMPWVIMISIFCCLWVFGNHVTYGTSQDRITASKMAIQVFKQYFDSSLSSMGSKDMPLRAACAAALIINNMSEQDIAKLRTMAIISLGTNENGNYIIDKSNISIASKMISDYLDKNPELAHNVIRIMRGEQPTTYFITNATQRTR